MRLAAMHRQTCDEDTAECKVLDFVPETSVVRVQCEVEEALQHSPTTLSLEWFVRNIFSCSDE